MASFLRLVEDNNSSDDEEMFPLSNQPSTVPETSRNRQFSIVTVSDNDLPQNEAATRAVRWLISNVTANSASRESSSNLSNQRRTIDLTSDNPDEDWGNNDDTENADSILGLSEDSSPILGWVRPGRAPFRLHVASSEESEAGTLVEGDASDSEVSNQDSERSSETSRLEEDGVPSDASSSTLTNSAVLPEPEFPTPVLPQPELPTPVLPQPELPTPVLPQPELPTPVLPQPELPTPVLPQPELPTPVLPRPILEPVLTDALQGNELASQQDFLSSSRWKQHNKRKLSSPSEACSPKKVKENSQGSESDDEMNCPICFEPWTNSGKHRLVSLKCGHLFGQKCVERWLKECHQKCPQCNVKAKKSEVRVIYAKKLKAVDTSELENAIKVADKVKAEKREREMELAKVRMQYEMAMEECNRLKSKVTVLMDNQPTHPTTTSQQQSSNQTNNGKFFQLYKNIVITPSGGCRVMDFDKRSCQFVISQPSPRSRFMTGFGVKRLSGMDFKSGCFTLLHQKVIKDLRFNPLCENQLLSASQDGTLRITDMLSNSKVHEYKVGKPVWSCCWDTNNRNIIYSGLNNGSFMQFDLRNTSEAMSTMENTWSRCPVVSLYHVPPTANDKFQGRGGLFSATLKGACFWQDTMESTEESTSFISNFKPTFLPLETGSCAGLCYNPSTNHCLVTFRPGGSYRKTTHLLGELQSMVGTDGGKRISCNIVETFYGGQTHKMLTRNSLHVLPLNGGDTLLACVGDEPNKKVQVYDVNRNKLVQCLPCDNAPPLDILNTNISNRNVIAALTDTTLKVFALD
uniref:E3 ubiquitin-protein ligase RFWD3 isoform X1 n=1 Tax=Ciona intestinalis TaxID=7719 RepID=UPI000180BAEB|nr:E3 ubiquitin-protein ligase RFWD3 isoform X1 [Ciona intestinalis]|eukprot:XP_002123329.1 E3 ubiquitin-protein ligase RFWD3 isoform X1 [Ciona intestinalis]